MNILAVDTSSDHGSAVVQMGGKGVAEVLSGDALQYSEHLFETIVALFDQARVTLDDIDVFAAARGPGSFTGLRVGMATIGGLAFARNKPARGFSTLAALAWQVEGPPPAETGPMTGESGPRIVPMLDARRGEVYGAVFLRRQEELVEVSPPAVLQPAAWLESLPAERTLFCGPGAEMHRKLIESRDGWDILEVRSHLAASIAAMAGVGNGDPFEPLYIRPTSAEVNRANR